MLVRWNRIAVLGVLAASASLAVTSPASADVIVSVDAPGVEQSQMAGVVTETFDSLAPGKYPTIVSPIGTYTAADPGGAVVTPDAYGGAYKTDYLTVGQYGGGAQQVTLTFNAPQSYFGFYFAAIDPTNEVDVYNGSTLVASINESTLSGLLSHTGGPNGTGHYGNPDYSGVDTGEAFAYVNVTGTLGSTFDHVVFSNFSSSGLETDNHSIAAVPEPGSLVSLGLGLVGLVGYRLRRRVSAAK